MQQFTVPQFIDVEDKIIGPITTRQFLIILTAFVISAVSYKIFDFSLFLVITIFVMSTAGIFAFLKINSMPFHYFILNFIQTLKKPKLRVWNNKDEKAMVKIAEKQRPPYATYMKAVEQTIDAVAETIFEMLSGGSMAPPRPLADRGNKTTVTWGKIKNSR